MESRRLNRGFDLWAVRAFLMRVVAWMFCAMVLVDNVNAFVRKELGFNIAGSPSQVYKILMFALAIAALNRARLKVVLLLFLTGFAFLAIHWTMYAFLPLYWQSSLVADLAMIMRMMTFPVFALYAAQLVEWGQEFWIRRIFYISYGLVAFNMILSMFGFGYYQYEGSRGALGYFISGNEVSGMLLVLSAYVLDKAWAQTTGRYLLVALFTVFIGALKGTKTGILGVLILAMATPFSMLSRFSLRLNPWKIIAGGVVAMIGVPLLLVAVVQAVLATGVIDRWLFFVAEKGLVTALFSDRNLRVAPFFKAFCDEYHWGLKFFGLGAPDGVHRGFIELDGLDILASYGLIGLSLMTLGFVFLVVFCLYEGLARRNRSGITLAILLSILFLVANTAGHIVYSAFALPFLGLYVGEVFARKKSLREERIFEDSKT